MIQVKQNYTHGRAHRLSERWA